MNHPQKIKIFIDGKNEPQLNMQKDIDAMHNADSMIRIYGWKADCITYGSNQLPEKLISLENIKTLGIEIARRPTGGGLVFHSNNDVSYSIIASKSILHGTLMDAYMLVSGIVLRAIKRFVPDAEIASVDTPMKHSKIFENICFSLPAGYEITHAGKKLVGSAQKRERTMILQQGTIAITKVPDEYVNKCLSDVGGYYSNTALLSEIASRKISFDDVSQELLAEFEIAFS